MTRGYVVLHGRAIEIHRAPVYGWAYQWMRLNAAWAREVMTGAYKIKRQAG